MDWTGWLEENPQATYYNYLQGLQKVGQYPAFSQYQWYTPAANKYYQGQFGNTWNKYLAELANQIEGGKDPTLSFKDYMQNLMPTWGKEYQNLPGWQRGVNNQGFSPRYRWLMY